jgi:hypothetical protein
MKEIELKQLIRMLAANIDKEFSKREYPTVYIKDNEKQYHIVNELDLYTDRIKCDDGYWFCYEWIYSDEIEGNVRLFIEV